MADEISIFFVQTVIEWFMYYSFLVSDPWKINCEHYFVILIIQKDKINLKNKDKKYFYIYH